MNSVDWFYATELPVHFFAEHPVGSVMGKAKYGDNFFFYQGCTVGVNYLSNGETVKPTIGNNVLMLSNSSIYGSSHVGNNVIISANAKVINDNIPDNSIVFGSSPSLIVKTKSTEEIMNRLKSITNLHY